MCLAIPVRVIALLGENWVDAQIGGVVTRVSIAFIEDVALGDYLIVHAGFAITRLDVAEAEITLALFADIAAHLQGGALALYSRLS